MDPVPSYKTQPPARLAVSRNTLFISHEYPFLWLLSPCHHLAAHRRQTKASAPTSLPTSQAGQAGQPVLPDMGDTATPSQGSCSSESPVLTPSRVSQQPI